MNKMKRIIYYLKGLIFDVFRAFRFVVAVNFSNKLQPVKPCSKRVGSNVVLNQFLQNKLNVLSDVVVDRPSNWNSDPYSGYYWSPYKWHKLTNIERPKLSDIKIPWEISRMQDYLFNVAAFNSDRAYNKFVCDINRFVDSNVVGFGVNYACSMDVSIRAHNLVLFLKYFYKNDLSANDNAIVLLRCSLAHIEYYDEKNGDVRNNHYLTNILGVLSICWLLFSITSQHKYLDKIKIWYRKLLVELDYQFDNSGMNFEGSFNYHRLSCEIVFNVYLILKEIDLFDLSYLSSKIGMMLEHLKFMRNTLGFSHVGDTDSGFILDLNTEYIQVDDFVIKNSAFNSIYMLDFPKFDSLSFEALFQYVNTRPVNIAAQKPKLTMSDSLDTKNWRFFVGADKFDNSYLNLSCGVCKLFTPNGWLLIKFKGTNNSGHSHYDFMRTEVFFDDTYYSLFPGTGSYVDIDNSRFNTRVNNYHHSIDWNNPGFSPLPFGGEYKGLPIVELTKNYFSVVHNDEYIKIYFRGNNLVFDSNVLTTVLPRYYWLSYGVSTEVCYL
ncbi:hypothetical protein [Vibrio echinoideorum]|uniref:Heparin-sulfate lyase N-terminal domain-containing protein n=1 Tax=Vibrio echinoideorum TaxID=2100116 RepID=A0ABU9FT02_9VIBR